MLSKAHLTSHSRVSGSRWVITPSWISGSWRSFLYSSSVYSCHLFLISSTSFRSVPFLSFISADLWMKCSLGISSILEEISSLSHLLFSSVYLHWSLRKPFLSLLGILWNSALKWIYLSSAFSFFSFLSYLWGLLRQSFCLFAFLFLGDGLDHCLLYNVTNVLP